MRFATAILALAVLSTTLAPLASAVNGGCATTYAGATTTNAGNLAGGAATAGGNAADRQGDANAVLVEGVRVGTLILTYYGTFLNGVRYVQSIVPMGPFAATDQFFQDQLASTGEALGHYGQGIGGGFSGTTANAFATADEVVTGDGTDPIAGQTGATLDFVTCAA